MNRLNRLRLWLFNGSVPEHRAVAAWVYIAVIAAISAAFHGPTWMHGLVQNCCAFQGNELDGPEGLRLLGGAFLVPNGSNFYWGLVPLALSLPSLERRVGSRTFVLLALAGHVGATLIVDGLAALIGMEKTLNNVDVGSSVVMLTCVAALTVVTRSWKLALIVLVGLAIDAVTQHDQATAEHFVGIVIGALMATVAMGSGASAQPKSGLVSH